MTAGEKIEEEREEEKDVATCLYIKGSLERFLQL